MLKIAEKKYYRDLIIYHKDYTRKSWSFIKTMINKHRKSNIQCKFKLNNGTVTDDKKVISESFNNFFLNIGPTLAKSIPFIDKSPLSSMGDRVMESLYLQPVTFEEINNILVSLKNTAYGWDDISSAFLKLSTQQILQPLAHICNLSLTEGVISNQLKTANVIPLYKSEDPMLFNHYRNVSLLWVLSKVFKKKMYSRLLDFFLNSKSFMTINSDSETDAQLIWH